jgi:hypothetical protein
MRELLVKSSEDAAWAKKGISAVSDEKVVKQEDISCSPRKAHSVLGKCMK